MAAPPRTESEAKTRRDRIDPRLVAQGWILVDAAQAGPASGLTNHAVREYATDHGPADYALFVGGRLLGIVEAKKISLGPQNVLVQAERYARGASASPLNYRGLRVPFLYATNGDETWFHDVRSAAERSRKIADFHTPAALVERMGHDLDAACRRLAATPNDHDRSRSYQREANDAVEQAIAARKRRMLLAMATGTGKTFTAVNQIHRLLSSGVVRRVLFLVDRRALAAQAVRSFAAFTAEGSLKFDKIHEVYSQQFRREELDDEGDKKDEKFDPKLIPPSYLLAPDPAKPFVYVCTIQRMARNLFGHDAVFGGDESDDGAAEDDDADRLDIPVHAFDLIIADECHRGYTSSQLSLWRATLDHFDAIKLGLTATPAKHTAAYFTEVVYRYSYEAAVRDGHLVDYDLAPIHSGVRIQGVFLQEGEGVEVIDTESGQRRFDFMEDERQFESTEVERKITVPDSNRKILEEIKRHALAHEARHGRFPKTLIFAVNDLPKPRLSHADQLVDMARDVFGRGDAFVQKITGSKTVDRPLKRIKEFRNRPDPKIVVTVDMLSTGVDIPDLEYVVFLRPVKSRTLFVQMLGRGTRKGEKHPDKSHFVVFDCFGGSLFEYFRKSTDETSEMPAEPSRATVEIIEDVWKNKERDYNVRCLVKRLQRVDKEMSGDMRELFAAHVPDGDLGGFARSLPKKIAQDFTATMKILRDPAFQKLLTGYRRAAQSFVIAYGVVDTVTSEMLVRDALGNTYKPNDYIEAFAQYVKENQDRIDAIRVLLDKPRSFRPGTLGELRRTLAATEQQFTVERLQSAHAMHYKKDLVDLISMVKHAARQEEPLLTAAERVERALARLTAPVRLSTEQQAWLDRIRVHLVENLSIDREDFDDMPVFARAGGWKPANDAFGGELASWLERINEAIAA